MTSPKSRRFIPALQARAGKAAQQIKLPVRNYNRLRLYLKFRLFYELTEGSACNGELTYPRRIRFTPIDSIHYGAAFAAFLGLPAALSRHPACREVSYREQGPVRLLPSPYL